MVSETRESGASGVSVTQTTTQQKRRDLPLALPVSTTTRPRAHLETPDIWVEVDDD